jgi:hypothetical protein
MSPTAKLFTHRVLSKIEIEMTIESIIDDKFLLYQLLKQKQWSKIEEIFANCSIHQLEKLAKSHFRIKLHSSFSWSYSSEVISIFNEYSHKKNCFHCEEGKNFK